MMRFRRHAMANRAFCIKIEVGSDRITTAYTILSILLILKYDINTVLIVLLHQLVLPLLE